VVTLADSEGPLEFVRNDVNGCVVQPFAAEIARVIDALMDDHDRAERMGRRGREHVQSLGLSWLSVVEALVA
jgi:glycosyltransferase involved in cell wall biosynthesis